MSIVKVDIDYKPPEHWLHKWERTRILMLEEYYKLHVLRVARHNTRKGQNFFIEVEEELTAGEINELQFMLGDDHTRVKINAWRIQRGIPHWNKIFDRKLWRKEAKVIECWYCGNKIPLISVEDENDKSGEQG